MTTIDDRPTVTNPYVGPNPIEYGQPIYGRDLEIPDLRDTLISHRIVLFYAPSGAGKSSLVNAGLRPQLEERDFSVLPTIRVGNDTDAKLGNRYILSTIQSLDEARSEGWSRPVEELAELGLDGYLAELDELDESGKDPCLVFDQFEELFTLDPTDQAAKREFLTELGRCLRSRSRWALITMREDYIAQLDPYLTLIPTRLATRFRLDRLGPDAAMAAAQRPALGQGVDFTEQAAQRLVDNIRSVRVRRGDQITTEFGPHVEPVVLQVVCQRLWERLNLAADDAITVDDIDELGDVDDALADFCDDQIARAAAATGVTQLQIRDWIESELIGEQDFRTQALRGPGSEGDTVIRTLEDGHFLRSESRRGTNWYEIAHDRLTQPILNSNERWREDHLESLQARAREWNERDRPDSLLLRDEVLDDAQAWAEANESEIHVLDRQFLEASEAERQRVLDARRRNRRDRRITVVALFAVVVALCFGFVALKQADRAQQAEQKAVDAENEQARLVGQLSATAEDLNSALALLADARDTGDSSLNAQAEAQVTQAVAEQATVLKDVARVDAEAAEAEANPSEPDSEAARDAANALERAEADEAIAKAVAARSRALATQAELTALESDQSADELRVQAVSEEERARELRVVAVTADRAATEAELTAHDFTDPTEAERERGALENLQTLAAADQDVVSQNLLNSWVPQISSGKRGTPEGMDFQEIERAHEQLEEDFDALLLFSSDYISYSDPTFWVSLVPKAFPTADEALEWCERNDRGPAQCFAKFISDDLRVEATTRYQPAEEE